MSGVIKVLVLPPIRLLHTTKHTSYIVRLRWLRDQIQE